MTNQSNKNIKIKKIWKFIKIIRFGNSTRNKKLIKINLNNIKWKVLKNTKLEFSKKIPKKNRLELKIKITFLKPIKIYKIWPINLRIILGGKNNTVMLLQIIGTQTVKLKRMSPIRCNLSKKLKKVVIKKYNRDKICR